MQRNALSTAANCCQCANDGDLPCVMDALPVLAGRLQHQVGWDLLSVGYNHSVCIGQGLCGELLSVFL